MWSFIYKVPCYLDSTWIKFNLAMWHINSLFLKKHICIQFVAYVLTHTGLCIMHRGFCVCSGIIHLLLSPPCQFCNFNGVFQFKDLLRCKPLECLMHTSCILSHVFRHLSKPSPSAVWQFLCIHNLEEMDSATCWFFL